MAAISVDHIGIIVSNRESAERFVRDVLGLEPSDREPQGSNSAFYRCGETDIQLLQIDDPVIRERRLGKGNIARLEHIAIKVDDVLEEMHRLQEAGVELLSPDPIRSPHGRSGFTTDRGGLGIVLQLVDSVNDAGQGPSGEPPVHG